MAITLHTYVSDVTGITVRDVAGDGSQVELLIAGYKGLLSIRCIGKQGKVVRITDLRRSDRKRRQGKHPVAGLRAGAQDHITQVEQPDTMALLEASLHKAPKQGAKKGKKK